MKFLVNVSLKIILIIHHGTDQPNQLQRNFLNISEVGFLVDGNGIA